MSACTIFYLNFDKKVTHIRSSDVHETLNVFLIEILSHNLNIR